MSIVVKFGGSILKDDQAYQDVALELSVLKARYDKVYAIVSTKKGETERLMREVAGDELKTLEQALSGYSKNSKFDNPEVSKALIQGELESVDKIVEILGECALGVKQTESYSIIARGSYLYGHVLLPESKLKAKELKYDTPIEIISGFGAVDMNGNIVLLGRNASDYIAAIYAYLHNVEKIIFYKDIDGVFIDLGKPNQRRLDIITRQEFLNLGNLQVLDQRVLDIYGGEIVVRGLYDLDKSIKIPESGTIIKGLPESI